MKKLLIAFILSLIIIFSYVPSAAVDYVGDLVITESPWIDSRAYSDLNTLITSIGSTEETVFINREESVAILSVPANISLIFGISGAINNSGRLNIHTTNITADNHQIFTGSGEVDFAVGTNLRSTWFSDLYTAFTVTNDNYVTLIINSGWAANVTASVAVGDNVTLKWEGAGNRIVINSGFTLSNIKNIEAGSYQIFAGSGDFDFADGARLRTSWFKYLRSVIAWIETENVTLVVDKSHTVSTNLTVTSNITLEREDGAIISDDASNASLAINGPFISGLSQAFDFDNGTGVVTFGDGSILEVYSEFWGALGDASTNDSVAIQAAIDVCATSGPTTVRFMRKTYLANVVVKSDVNLVGDIRSFAVSGSNVPTLKAFATGAVIDTPAGATTGFSIRGLHILGLGDATPVIGIHLRNASKFSLEYLTIGTATNGTDEIADQAILIEDGNPGNISHVFGIALSDKTRAARSGVLQIEASAGDFYIEDSEFGAASHLVGSISDGNLYIVAVLIDGYGSTFSHVLAETADIGFYVGGAFNEFIASRGEFNQAHGWVVSGGLNSFVGSSATRNSLDTTNTYNGFDIEDTILNTFTGCQASSLSTNEPNAIPVGIRKHKYGFYDHSTTNPGSHNQYFNNVVQFAGTAWFASASGAHRTFDSWANSSGGGMAYFSTGTTPSVANIEFVELQYIAPETITNFTGGVHGQVIKILNSGASAVTLQNNANIRPMVGSDLVIPTSAKNIHEFIFFNSKWYEIGNRNFGTDITGAGAGADGTISSRNANPLGEATGFIKVYLAGGTVAYIPYWADITP